jgi:hypothetical protein
MKARAFHKSPSEDSVVQLRLVPIAMKQNLVP